MINTNIFNYNYAMTTKATGNYETIYYMLQQQFEQINITPSFTLASEFQGYYLIIQYLRKGYSKIQINKILKSLGFNIQLNLDNLNMLALFEEIFIKYLHNLYNSQEFKEYCNAFRIGS